MVEMFKEKDIEINASNVVLPAKLYISTESSDLSCLVTLSYGLGGNMAWLEQKAMDICNSGNIVLLFDFRGHGETDGIANEEIINDLQAVVEYAKNLYKDVPIILGGQCMGGLFSLHEAVKDDRVIGVIGMSITPEWVVTAQIWEIVIRNMEDMKGGHKVKVDKDSLYKVFRDRDVRQSLKALKRKSLLLIHYEKDEISSVENAWTIFQEAACEKT